MIYRTEVSYGDAARVCRRILEGDVEHHQILYYALPADELKESAVIRIVDIEADDAVAITVEGTVERNIAVDRADALSPDRISGYQNVVLKISAVIVVAVVDGLSKLYELLVGTDTVIDGRLGGRFGRSLSRSFGRRLCGSLCGGFGRSLSRGLGGGLGGSLGGSLCRSLGRRVGRMLPGPEGGYHQDILSEHLSVFGQEAIE